jgi:S-DNA-T family DNA segregation ATPase FtsK/SpoIIIE
MAPEQSETAPRLLPHAWGQRLSGWAAQLFGLALLLATLAAGASLLSWSVVDPSLTRSTSGDAINYLGPFGAIVADLLMQMLGLAGILALLPPVFWSIEMMTLRRLDQARMKLFAAPVGLMLIAVALATLPVTASWPLKHNFGGIVGDLGLSAAVSLLGVLNPGKAHLAAGLMAFAVGATLMLMSLGLSRADVDGLIFAKRNDDTRPKRNWTAWLSRPRASKAAMAPPIDLARGMDGNGPYDPHHLDGPRWDAAPRRAMSARSEPETELRRDPGFDNHTDQMSRVMAERFAPPGALAAGAGAVERVAPAAPPRGGQNAAGGGGFFSHFGSRRSAEPAYKKPSVNMLKKPPSNKPGPEFTQNVLRGNARLLEDVLNDFGIKGEVKDIKPGPVVTLFELEPARGTKSSRVIGLADDIARSMSATAVRVAGVPGRNVLGIELPNMRRETVYLRELLESEAFRTNDGKLPLILGKAINGEPVIADLAKMPHLLVAGTTGSGKSVGVNAMILSLLYRLSPDECRFLMIDPKMLELSVYNGIPHLLTPVVTDPQRAVAALNWIVGEMEERYKRMAALSVRNIEVFNNRVRNAGKQGQMMTREVQTGFDKATGQAVFETQSFELEVMPHFIVVVDEFADLMMVAGKEIEAAVQRLAQMARAAGIHLIMATQRPSVDIITGTIKANFPTRVSFKVTSKIDSRTILNEQGAEQLLGQGDMLFAAGNGTVVRVHGPFVSDDEVEAIAGFLGQQGAPRYIDGITDVPEQAPASDLPGGKIDENDLYDRAVAIVLRDQKASTSYIQRRLSIGYNRAADLIERMERDGIVSPANHAGKRQILAGPRGPASDAA